MEGMYDAKMIIALTESSYISVCDGAGRPVRITVSAGNEVYISQEKQCFEPVVCSGATVISDRGYDACTCVNGCANARPKPVSRPVKTARRRPGILKPSTKPAISSSAVSIGSKTGVCCPCEPSGVRKPSWPQPILPQSSFGTYESTP